MKRIILALVVCAFVATPAMADFWMHTANSSVGNQVYNGVGLRFNVNSQINVLKLGIYDSGQDGIQPLSTGGDSTLSTVIFDSTLTPVVQVDFTSSDPGTLVGAYRWKTLATPLTLTPGQHTIVGYGFNAGNKEHNMKGGGTGPTFDDGDGMITFIDSVWGSGQGDLAGTYPVYLGGDLGFPLDYFDGPNMAFVPEPGAALLAIFGLTTAGVKLRRRRA